jgi:phosphopantetheine adenylyltransferase
MYEEKYDQDLEALFEATVKSLLNKYTYAGTSLMESEDRYSRTVSLFLGRFQPMHAGHLKVISKMTNPVVCIIKGKKSSEDKDTNPFPLDVQIKIAERLLPKTVRVISSDMGYVPAIIDKIQNEFDEQVNEIYCGPDRVVDYKKQIDRVNSKLPEGAKLDVKVISIDRDDDGISATKVRESLKGGDVKKFTELTSPKLTTMFNQLREYLV